MKNTLKRNSQRYLLIAPLLGGLAIAAMMGGCAPEKGHRDPQQQQQAQTLVKNAQGLLNPTVSNPTEIEGTWLAPCVPGSFAGGAKSFTKGYIFMGNSFYRQIDYYSSSNCSWSGDQTLAQGRLYAKIAAGWFSVGAGTGSLKQINLLAAPNFGSTYEFNVYSVSGSGNDKILSMGDDVIDSTQRPSSTSINFTHWDTSTYGNLQ